MLCYHQLSTSNFLLIFYHISTNIIYIQIFMVWKFSRNICWHLMLCCILSYSMILQRLFIIGAFIWICCFVSNIHLFSLSSYNLEFSVNHLMNIYGGNTFQLLWLTTVFIFPKYILLNMNINSSLFQSLTVELCEDSLQWVRRKGMCCSFENS